MKKIFFILLFISTGVLIAQEVKPFSHCDIGFYGGINFNETSNIGGDFLVEFKTYLIPSLQLKAAIGYLNTSEPFTDTVRTIRENPNIDSLPRYFVSKYNYENKVYDMFPVALGIQYTFVKSVFSPYVTADAVYNFITGSLDTSPSENWTYNSYEEIPDEFKQEQKSVELPDNSFGVMLGAGTSYRLSSKLNLDLRYFFKYDSEIVNTHHIVVGIYF